MGHLRLQAWMLAATLGLAAMPASAGRPAVADTLESVKVLQVEGIVVIDTQGGVEDYRIQTPLNDALRGLVDKAVHRWRFRPVVVDGQVRRAEARMRITLAATAMGEDYQVRVDNVIFPDPDQKPGQPAAGDTAGYSARKLAPPVYPQGLMRANVSGTVLLAIRMDASGRAADVAAVQSMLMDVRGREKVLQIATGMMEQASVSAAKRWTFNLPADFERRPPDQRVVMVPVEFLMESTPKSTAAGIWRTVVRTPVRKVDWLPQGKGTQAVGVADLRNGEFVPVASQLSLVSEVVGNLL